MAKVVSPLHSTEARARMGGIVYNTWRGLHTVRAFVSPSQPRSATQLAVRAQMVSNSRAWAGLTSVQRAGWDTWATDHKETDWTGTPLRLTGHNWYCRLSTRLTQQGKATVATAPAAVAPANVAALVATPGAGQVSLAFTAFGGTATSIDVWIQPPHSAGVKPRIQKAKHKAYGPGETTPLVVTGLIAGLNTAFVRAVSETDGQASQFISVDFTVT